MDEDHRGLVYDLRTLVDRRRVLGLFGGVAATTLLAACSTGGGTGGGSGSGSSSGTSGSGTTSTADGALAEIPDETNGPFPADGSNGVNVLDDSGIVRSDIRSSFGSLSGTAAGVPLTLTATIVNTSASCALLSGYVVYVWHCDGAGKYSLYDTPTQNYLRGVQTTDAAGQVTFQTIFPGCYSGRYPHIHFEVFQNAASATSGRSALLISQMAMPSAACSAVYSANSSTYSGSSSNFARTTTSNDNVFGDNTAAQIAAQTPTLNGSPSAGYTGTVVIGLAR